MNKFLICITGGHLTPALSVIEEIQNLKSNWQILFVGRSKAMENDTVVSEECRIIREKNIEFLPLTAGRFRRFISFATIKSFFRIPLGFIQSLRICCTRKPRIIISFGGYVGLPMVVAGWICRIPIVIHEQNQIPGLANRISAYFATRIFVSYPTSIVYFNHNKTIHIGLPIRKVIFHPPTSPTFKYNLNIPILYITGGSTGARSINLLFYPIISRLTKTFNVIHQVGAISLSEAKKFRQNLRSDKRNNYFVFAYVNEKDHAWLLYHAKLVISRSGANTVGELAITQTKTIFIPLPWSAGNEQMHNAQSISRPGRVIVLNQQDLTSEQLLNKILEMTGDSNKINTENISGERIADVSNAATKMVVSISELLNK
jgi:UDP-N-acetylglucosamine--N-acetylmuramyl-(pentapeptide) pyrophosphoryl-undecaprenol N-acetylglucosamine transferase